MYRLISLILTRMTATRDDDRGATMVEYGLLVALISVVAIAFIITIGDEVATAFSDVADALTADSRRTSSDGKSGLGPDWPVGRDRSPVRPTLPTSVWSGLTGSSALMRVRRDERGASMVEYSLLLVFIALAAITAVAALGLEVASLFEGIDLPG